MTEESPPGIGTVAQEAARLIEDMATMARSGYGRSNGSSAYAGEPAQEPVWADAPPAASPADDYDPDDYEPEGHHATGHAAGGSEAGDDSREDACSMCGGERDNTQRDETPSTCKICPLCRGISLLRSVRPETVDMLADLALSVAAGLRDVATRSRASDSASSARSRPGGSPDPGRDSVQDIPVDDESQGQR